MRGTQKGGQVKDIGPDGAILVRLGRFVVWRSQSPDEDPRVAMDAAFDKILR